MSSFGTLNTFSLKELERYRNEYTDREAKANEKLVEYNNELKLLQKEIEDLEIKLGIKKKEIIDDKKNELDENTDKQYEEGKTEVADVQKKDEEEEVDEKEKRKKDSDDSDSSDSSDNSDSSDSDDEKMSAFPPTLL